MNQAGERVTSAPVLPVTISISLLSVYNLHEVQSRMAPESVVPHDSGYAYGYVHLWHKTIDAGWQMDMIIYPPLLRVWFLAVQILNIITITGVAVSISLTWSVSSIG